MNLEKYIFTKDDLELAWKRLREDIKNKRLFFVNTDYIHLVEKAKDVFLDGLLVKLNNNTYTPSNSYICEVPKSNGGIRPGCRLTVEDAIVYTTIIGVCFPQIYKTLKWSQNKIDYAYILDKPNKEKWIQNQFIGWESFRKESVRKLTKSSGFVLFCDITGYYENIDRQRLLEYTRQLNVCDNLINILSSQIKKWSQIQSKGIPQGYSASDILGKLYLNSIDERLFNNGYTHLRYVDDYRFFCPTKSEARRAQAELIRSLRTSGLNLQSAKSEVLRTDIAKVKIEGVIPVLKKVKEEFVEEIKDKLNVPYEDLANIDYLSLSTFEKILTEQPEDEENPPLQVLRSAYETYFIEATEEEFDKTLFRFILTRLGAQADNFALAHCLGLLKTNPEETEAILNYLSNIDVDKDSLNFIYDFITSEYAIYPYQNYKILEWYSNFAYPELKTKFIRLCRKLFSNKNIPPDLISICRTLLGKNGAISDLENIIISYQDNTPEEEKVEILLSIRKLETGRRNLFYSQVANTTLLKEASILAKSSC
ncbi:MAG: RNA-directed DNA polymerase [Patescibacteria group bacterium]